MRRPRRNHSAKFEAAGLAGGDERRQTTAELSSQFDVQPNQIADWKAQLLEQAEGVFLTKAERKAAESGPSTKDLQAKIGQLTKENDFLESALGWIHGPSAKR